MVVTFSECSVNRNHLKRSRSETFVFKIVRRSLDGALNYLIIVQDIVSVVFLAKPSLPLITFFFGGGGVRSLHSLSVYK